MKTIEKEIKKIQELLHNTHVIPEEVDEETQQVFENYDVSNKAYEELEKIAPSLWLNFCTQTDAKIHFAEEILYHLQKQIEDEKMCKTLDEATKKLETRIMHLKKGDVKITKKRSKLLLDGEVKCGNNLYKDEKFCKTLKKALKDGFPFEELRR